MSLRLESSPVTASASPLPSLDAMMRAFYARDAAAEGIFLVGVHTTGIFCRPTCGARKPKPENVSFYRDATAALHDGYRPCKLCKPLDAIQPPPALVLQLRELVDAQPTERITEQDLLDRSELMPGIDEIAQWLGAHTSEILEAEPVEQVEETLESADMI